MALWKKKILKKLIDIMLPPFYIFGLERAFFAINI